MATKATKPRPNGAIVYEGPSRIDGSPIVVIVTGLSRKSANAKTDAMFQTWILRSDVAPLDALRTGSDKSICGGCIHRPKSYDGKSYSRRSCYVNVAQGPTSVYRAYKRGSYPRVSITDLGALVAGKLVRFGSYGDPAAVPTVYWQVMKAAALAVTGYTHQWRSARLRDTLSVCQLSADTPEDVASAESLGVGSFRVKRASDPTLPGEIVCPASAEAGHVASCATCRMCDGASGHRVVINAHGIGAAQFSPRPGRTLAVIA
jgi:hypothetical protein